jgi:hypothetical protein
MSFNMGMCSRCRHFEPGMDDRKPSCLAFPDGIPGQIVRRGFDHRNEYPGDGGIRFEPDGPVSVDWIEKRVAPAKP